MDLSDLSRVERILLSSVAYSSLVQILIILNLEKKVNVVCVYVTLFGHMPCQIEL